MRKILIYSFIVLIVVVFIYDKIAINNLSPPIDLVRQEVSSQPDAKKISVSDGLLSLYPIGMDKNKILKNLSDAGFEGHVIIDPAKPDIEVYHGKAWYWDGLLRRLTLNSRRILITLHFKNSKLAGLEAYAFE